MSESLPHVVVSSGEPAGIGPDVSLALAKRAFPARLAVLGDVGLLAERAHAIGESSRLVTCEDAGRVAAHAPGTLQVLPIALRAPVAAGVLDTANASYVLDMLRTGTELCLRGTAHALVTGPVQKSVIARSGVEFSGHTEFLATLTRTPRPVMLLANERVRVALVTTHLPLRAVADAIDEATLGETIRVVHGDLRRRLRIDAPRILVLGLNPHAGESGTLGTEEQRIIGPVVRTLRAQGLDVEGPVSADTAFTPDSLARCDVVVAMYHDQGLPALKALAFGETVNITLGLPIVRTSVDHGTALALAGSGRARPDSLYAAVDLAIALA